MRAWESADPAMTAEFLLALIREEQVSVVVVFSLESIDRTFTMKAVCTNTRGLSTCKSVVRGLIKTDF